MAASDQKLGGEIINIFPLRSDCLYHSCYCEENIWNLCSFFNQKLSKIDINCCSVAFVSNESKTVPIWMQKAAEETGPVIWDYHVILVVKLQSGPVVLDLDTRLPFPCSADRYCLEAFRTGLKSNYTPKFRIISAPNFLTHFASDRSHMLNSNGEYMSPPPCWPPIQTASHKNTFDQFISMKPTVDGDFLHEISQLIDLDQFRLKFCNYT